jgi:hypothetical protein
MGDTFDQADSAAVFVSQHVVEVIKGDGSTSLGAENASPEGG